MAVQLLEDGAPYVAPAGAVPYTFAPSVTVDDASLTIAPATADVTSGAVPVAQQFLLTDSSADAGTSFDLTITATAPDGTPLSEVVTISLTAVTPPPASPFSLSATVYPAPVVSAEGVRGANEVAPHV